METESGGVRFKFLFQKRNSEKLYVFLNGAAGLDHNQADKYQRWSWGNLTGANILNILDPMYNKYIELPIGWYWGTSEVNYRKEMGDLISQIAKKLGVSFKNIILYGSSAGGTGSLYTAHYLPGCMAVAINPQIRPWKHEWGDKFKEIVGVDLQKNDKFHRNDINWHIMNSVECKYLIIANCRSRVDFNWQIVPMAQKFKFKTHYGLMQHGNLYLWIFDTGQVNQYRAMEYPAMFLMINDVIELIQKGQPVSQIKDRVLLVNEVWRDHWEINYKFQRNRI